MNVPTMATILETLPLGVLAVVATAKAYYLAFAVLSIAGGIMGYVKAKSAASFLAGTISGILLISASYLLPERPILSGVIALCVSVMLAGKFVPDFVHKKAFLPGGLMAVLSVASIVLTILAMLPK